MSQGRATEVLVKAFGQWAESGLATNLNALTQEINTSGLWVGTSAVGVNALMDRKAIEYYNESTTTAFFGPSGVTPATGRPLHKYNSWTLDAGSDIDIYCLTATGSTDIRVTELR